MALLGALLKESVKWKQKQNKGIIEPTEQLQIEVLNELLTKASSTEIGMQYDFSSMVQSEDVQTNFQNSVPLFSYESYYDKWLIRALEDKPNIIWPGKINYFAKSSGTTKSGSKRIPVSTESIRYFHKAAFQQLSTIHQFNFPARFYQSDVLTIGGCTRLTTVGEHLEGDLSGILKRTKPFIFRPFAKPGKRLSKVSDWEVKMDAIVEKSPYWNIGVVAGNPSWVCLLLEKIVQHYDLKWIQDIWPNFSMYLHGGVFLGNYEKRIQAISKFPIMFVDTYLASEGYFAYQTNPLEKGMDLLLNHGVYYEFIESNYFEKLNQLRGDYSGIPTLSLNEVEEGKPYALVVSTCSGLWRYVIGDVVRFSNLNKYTIQIVGRIAHTMNSVGEHLSLENMMEAINEVADIMGVEVSEFCVTISSKNDRHFWYIGSKQVVNEQLFAVHLNSALEKRNDDYCAIRKVILKAPKVKALPEEKFYEFMERKGKLGAQHKFPRVLNAAWKNEWENFLANPILTGNLFS